jgi:hypothetical protein
MRLVEILWNDAFEVDGTDWFSAEELEQRIPVDKKGEAQLSIGYVFRENDNGIILVQTHTPEENDKKANSLSGILFIPRPMILEVRDK